MTPEEHFYKWLKLRLFPSQIQCKSLVKSAWLESRRQTFMEVMKMIEDGAESKLTELVSRKSMVEAIRQHMEKET